MNWRLGLFRLWVLFSALWIAGCSVIAVMQWRESQRTVAYEVTDPEGLKYRVTAPVGTSEDDAVRFMLASPDVAKRRADCLRPKVIGPWCDYQPELRMPGNLDLWPILLAAVLGPIGVLVFARGVLWAISGFRKSRPKGSQLL